MNQRPSHTPDLLQRVKFGLWDFSRTHPILGKPIRYLGKESTRNFQKNHTVRMQALGDALLPPDRYIRPLEVPTQFFVFRDGRTSPEATKGLSLLMNHLRIPYRSLDPDTLDLLCASQQPAVLVTTHLSLADIQQILPSLKTSSIGAVAFATSNTSTRDDRIKTLSLGPENLLPHRLGLRSELTRSFIEALLSLDQFPVITGLLRPQIGLRIDDVAGIETRDYLDPLLQHGWSPNLGIFTDDFASQAEKLAPDLSTLATENLIEMSPHAFSANHFLFFDYKNAMPYSQVEFNRRWHRARSAFDRWNFPVSPVLNAHFHAVSTSAYPALEKSGVRYHFSELKPDGISVQPDAHYLPGGDPICTTGQINHVGPLQIFSGDSAQNCNWPDSLYDFLMHPNETDPVSTAVQKIIRRLDRSLFTGFAAFATTHEYLLNTRTVAQHTAIWEAVESHLANHRLAPQKARLSELGKVCENHTQTVIDNVQWSQGKWVVHLRGKSRGESYLSVFLNRSLRSIPIPPFNTSYELVVK